jgi:O-antigen ligase
VASTVAILTLVATVLVVWRGAEDPFTAPKLVVLCGGATAAGLAVVARTWRRVDRVLAVLVGAFVVALLLATALAIAPRWSMIGPPMRGTGALAYGALALLALAASTGGERAGVRLLVAVTSVGALQGAILTVQAAGADPFSWGGISQIVGTTGNPNFSAATCAFAIPAGAALVLRSGTDRRGAAALGAILFAVAGLLAGASTQGWIAGLAGLVAVGLGWKAPRLGERSVAPMVIAAATVAVLLAIGGAMVLRSTSPSIVERRHEWAAAATIVSDHPIVGVGPGGYALEWAAARPASFAAERPLRAVDDPHSVPLAMGASGGVLLAGAYATLVVGTGLRGLRGLARSHDRTQRLVLAGVLGVWLSYQAQSSVSIDQPGLSVVHWVSLGTIWAISGPRADDSWAARALAAALVVAAAAGTVVSVQVVRAEAHLRSASELVAAGDVDAAAAEIRAAARLRPHDARYATAAVRLEARDGASARRLAESAGHAAELGPGLPEPLQIGAQAWLRAGDLDEAQAWFAAWRAADPNNPVALAGAARVEASMGNAAEARGLLDRALEPAPGTAGGWLAVGDAAAALDEEQIALDAYERALTTPDDDSASARARVARANGDPRALVPR